MVSMATMAIMAAMVAMEEVMMKDGAAQVPVEEAGASGLGAKVMGQECGPVPVVSPWHRDK